MPLITAPIPAELSALEKLEYRKQVLERAVSPVLGIVLEAHRRNLYVADSLSLVNEWTRASETRILSAVTFMGNQFARLGLDALEGYRHESGRYQTVTLTNKSTAPEAIVTSIINFVDLSKTYMQQALRSYQNSVTISTYHQPMVSVTKPLISPKMRWLSCAELAAKTMSATMVIEAGMKTGLLMPRHARVKVLPVAVGVGVPDPWS